MKRMLALFIWLLGLTASAIGEGPKVELRDGDRVVLIGDALIERDQEYGYLETLLTIQNPDKSITFRNLGWSGDTVFGEARAGFGRPADGFTHLKEHVLALRPTVVIVGYGMSDSFAGEAGLPRFVSGLNTLLDVIAETKARVVMLSPIAHEDLGRPLPDPSDHNRSLRLYRDAIRKVSEERGHRFVDLFDELRRDDEKAPEFVLFARGQHLTDDGIHPNRLGSWLTAMVVTRGIGLDRASDRWMATIGKDRDVEVDMWDDSSKPTDRDRPKLGRVEASPSGIRIEMTEASLPWPLQPPASPRPLRPSAVDATTDLGPPVAEQRTEVGHLHFIRLMIDGREVACTFFDPSGTHAGINRSFSVKDRPAGRYLLKIDGREAIRADFDGKAMVLVMNGGPDFDQVERLRKTINEKNRLYFYRWRPQNETYLFGFRKHEQGVNAREIPLFDPLVDAKEKEIAAMRKPVSHVYEIVREGEVGR